MNTLLGSLMLLAFCTCLGAKDLHLVDGRVFPAVAINWDANGQLKVIHGSGVISISPALLSEADRIEFNLKYPKPAPVIADNPASQFSGTATSTSSATTSASGMQRLSSSSETGTSPVETQSTSRWTISSTGKRHNSNCRYYGRGSSCGPTAGIACKICGG
ncbi:hypothetical protein [Verrucomicrobium spinosum]|uniref:hypothetical protein n=1 Tax=Verrucomicrobium spinosum TaxID=2736 RepID=UPI0012E1F88F|nr:hypothetical protein [Verrucomicrobium spinosum]